MEFLTPPTDNVYKFFAIAGIAVALFVPSFCYVQLNAVLDQEDKIEEELTAIRLEISFYKEDLDSTRNKNQTGEDQARILEAGRNLAKRNALQGQKLQTIHRLNSRNKYLPIVAVIGLVIGACMAISGFYLWYVRLQKFQDEITKREAQGKSRRV